MTDLYCVLYCSRNRILGSREEVDAALRGVLDKSRFNNAKVGVTGGLLFSHDCFAQILEGPMDRVEATFDRIQCDSRHGDVTVLIAEPIAARDFSDWSMAYVGSNVAADPRASAMFSGAFAGHSPAGAQLLGLMRSVVARETEWQASTPAFA